MPASTSNMVGVLDEELKIDIEGDAGSTHKRKRDLKGTAPYTCFHIGNVDGWPEEKS